MTLRATGFVLFIALSACSGEPTPMLDPCLAGCRALEDACVATYSHGCEYICLQFVDADGGISCLEQRMYFVQCAQRLEEDGYCLSSCWSQALNLSSCIERICDTQPDDPRCP